MATPLTEAVLLDLTGETSTQDIKELTLRSQKLQSFEQFAIFVPSLTILSLSHNQVATLQGIAHLPLLVSLNVNFNALTSLEGIQHCANLQHLFANSNRIRDIEALAGLQNLQTLHVFRNSIAQLDAAIATLATLPHLKELEFGGNPCSVTEDYKPKLVAQLQLETLDGESLTHLDHELATEYFDQHVGMLQQAAQVLTLDDEQEQQAAASSRGAGSEALEAAAQAARASHPAALPRPGSALLRPLSSSNHTGQPYGPARPNTASVSRPGTAYNRPGTASGRPNTPSLVQLYSNEALNDHPLVLEYLAKHVLQEGLQLTQAVKPKGAFAQRLRDAAAVMNACEGLDPAELAARQVELGGMVPSTSTARAAQVEQLISANTPHETIRQLLKLCETLIKEVETSRQHGRPSSSNGSTGGHSRPPSAGAGAAAAAASAAASAAAGASAAGSGAGGGDEVVALRGEVERLQREVKQLKLENSNMFWLADEVKRLKGELRAAREQQQQH